MLRFLSKEVIYGERKHKPILQLNWSSSKQLFKIMYNIQKDTIETANIS